MILRINSLQQLIIMSFALVLIPLVALLWQSNATISDMAQTAASEPVYAVNVSRNVNQLERLALDIERVTRQYQVVRKPELQDLALNYMEKYLVNMESLCTLLSLGDSCSDNSARLNDLRRVYTSDEDQLTQALSALRLSLNRIKQATASQLDDRLLTQQTHIQQVKAKQFWFTVAIITLSLTLALYGSNKILSPVRKIETLITELADKEHELSPVSDDGPKELVELERKLHLLARRLTQLENVRQTMLRHAAHELKTPLASVKEGCSLLLEQVLGELNERQLEVVQLLDTSSMRLENLISQLLDYNMLLQQAKPEFTAIDCGQFMQAFIADHQLALDQNNHEIRFEQTLQTLYSDEILLRRIMDNLLSNAIAYGIKTSPILINVYQQEQMQVIEFANSGKPIGDEDKTRLFQPFQRGQVTRHDRIFGSGLGLSIVSECTGLLSGQVKFIDVDYADVCIQITLPIVQEGI